MKILMVGCSHKDTSIAVRERLAFSPEQVQEALRLFRRRFQGHEAVLLSTCNRTEFYVASGDQNPSVDSKAAIEFLAECRSLDAATIAGELIERHQEQAIAHLFSVASSVDSMVVGEAQILSQVKQAYELAIEIDDSLPITHGIFQRAIRVAKRVASETRIHERRVSVPSVAISELATQIFERFDDKQILVIGAGEMAEETLTYLQAHGASRIRIVNRTEERARGLAEKFSATVHPWSDLGGLLSQADMVISATGATEPIMTLAHYREIERSREQRTLFVLDLAIPRDFDPSIGDCLNVFLYSVDDLKALCDRNLKARQKELPKADRIIQSEAQKFIADLRHRSSIPIIQQLKEKAEEIKLKELERLLNRLDALDEREKEEIKYAFDRLVNKILHPPLESLRGETDHAGSRTLVEAVRRLFQLRD